MDLVIVIGIVNALIVASKLREQILSIIVVVKIALECLKVSQQKELSCHYNYFYNGIDRKDNDIGYVIENCVSCCDECNKAKRNMLYEKWIAYLDRIVAFRK